MGNFLEDPLPAGTDVFLMSHVLQTGAGSAASRSCAAPMKPSRPAVWRWPRSSSVCQMMAEVRPIDRQQSLAIGRKR